jgi:hypothetical protein
VEDEHHPANRLAGGRLADLVGERQRAERVGRAAGRGRRRDLVLAADRVLCAGVDPAPADPRQRETLRREDRRGDLIDRRDRDARGGQAFGGPRVANRS